MVQLLWKSLAVPLRVKHGVTNMTQQFQKRNENICPQINLYMNVHSSTIHNSQKGETPKCLSTDAWMNKTWHIHATEYYSTIKKEQSTNTCCNTDKP